MSKMFGGSKLKRQRDLKLKMVDHHSSHGHHQSSKLASSSPGGRIRNDSGCFDDDCSSSSSGGSPDFLSAHWDEVVSQWAGKNHSIIAQEAVRMKTFTEARKAELQEARDPKERARVAQRWRDDMKDVMAFTQDLIQCVANDVAEARLEEGGEAAAGVTSQDLGKIIEEELFDEGAHNEEEEEDLMMVSDDGAAEDDDAKLFLVRTKKRRRHRHRRGGGSRRNSERRDSGEIRLEDGAVLHSEQTFTIQVDQVMKRQGLLDSQVVKSGSWQWRKDLDSPIIWADQEDNGDDTTESLASSTPASEPSSASVEDIYSDWLSMRRCSTEDVDINAIFWSIALGDQQQVKFSEALENAPFSDRPDILKDRCELLEGSKRRSRRFKKVRPQKTYWNIFSEWKRIFREEDELSSGGDKEAKKKVKARRRPRKKPRRARKTSSEAKTPEKQKQQQQPKRSSRRPRAPKRLGRPRRSSIHVIEDYFFDFLPAFAEVSPGRRRRSVEGGCPGRRAKRMRMERVQHSNTPVGDWALIQVESSRTKTFDQLTRSIERKIREAFVSESKTTPEEAAATACQAPLQEDFGAWPKKVARRIRKSRRRFEKLRGKVHKLREARRRSFERDDANMMAAFQEWTWNLREVEAEPEPEDFFEDWRPRHMDVEEQEDVAASPRSQQLAKAPRAAASGALACAARSLLFKAVAMEKARQMLGGKKAGSVKKKKAREENRLRAKCFAKQPMPRGGYVKGRM